jgi:Uma2 family endonuclease
MGEAAETRVATADEYLSLDRAAAEKHEFYKGEIFAMAGASPTHNLIVGNIITALNPALRAGPCRVFPSDLKIHVAGEQLFAYPDVSVVCGPLELLSGTNDVVENPKVILEVLSDSTEKWDPGEKFASYRRIESLTDFVFVSQHDRRLEHYARQVDGSWVLRQAERGGAVHLLNGDCPLTVDDVYSKAFEIAG